MSVTQLNPPIPVITPKGYAIAYFLVDYGPGSDLIWICFQKEKGEILSWENSDVRCKNIVNVADVFDYNYKPSVFDPDQVD